MGLLNERGYESKTKEKKTQKRLVCKISLKDQCENSIDEIETLERQFFFLDFLILLTNSQWQLKNKFFLVENHLWRGNEQVQFNNIKLNNIS